MTHRETKKQRGMQNKQRTKPEVTNDYEIKKQTTQGVIKGTEYKE